MSRDIFFAGLDIGTSAVRALGAVSRPDKEKLEVVARASESSFGVRKGVVTDPKKVGALVSSVLERIEEEAGRRVTEVFVALGGGHIFSTGSEGTVAVSRADQVISEKDVSRVIEAAKTFSLPKNREILRVFPQEFKVDEETGIREPLGMKGVRLESSILVVGYFTPYLDNLTEAVLDSGFQIGHVMSKPMASAKAVLTPRQKELGVLMLDIGAGTTSFAAFKEKILLKAGVVPVGSFNITKDIAVGLKVEVDTAERIKREHGACFLGGREKMEIEDEMSEQGKTSFSGAELGRIIDPRVKEILELVEKELGAASDTEFAGGVVLTGGGARLPKIANMAKEELGFVAKVASPKGFSPQQNNPSFSTVCGLIKEGRDFAEGADSWGRKVKKKIKRALRDLIP